MLAPPLENADNPDIGTVPQIAVDAADWFLDAKETVEEVGEVATGAADFAQDPLGAIAEALRNGAAGLVKDLLPALFEATSPDLTVSWFVSAYSLSFALGIIFWGFLLLFQMVGVARGRSSGTAFLNALLTRSGMYFGGVLFGPALAMILVKAVEALTNSLVSWGFTDTFKTMAMQLYILLDRDVASIVGGAAVAGLLMFAMVLGLLVVVFMQVILLVTLYLSGVFVPIALAWITSGKHEGFGLRIVYAWVGLLLSQPLLVFVLGVSFKFIGTTVGTLAAGVADNAAVFIQICAAVVALAMAGLAPLALLKFAPVIPKGGQSPDGPEASVAGFGPGSLREASDTFRSDKPESETANTVEAQPQGGADKAGGQASAGGGGGGPLVSHHQSLNSGGEGTPASGGAGASSGSEAAGAAGPEAGAAASGAASSGAKAGSAGAAASKAGTSSGAAAGGASGAAGVGVMALKKGAETAETGAHAAADAMDANPSDLPETRGDDD